MVLHKERGTMRPRVREDTRAISHSAHTAAEALARAQRSLDQDEVVSRKVVDADEINLAQHRRIQ
jgi:hypothetical protein